MDLGAGAALVLLIVSATIFLFSHHKKSATENNFTVLKSYPIVGNIPHIIKNRARLLDWVAELIPLGPTATVTVAPFVFTANPANVEHTTKLNFESYHKGPATTATLHDFFGHGIFNADGPHWQLQRKTASFEFNTKSLRSFLLASLRREVSQRLLPLLSQSSATGQALDLQDVLERFAFDNICNLVFGEDPNCLPGSGNEGEELYHALEAAAALSIYRWNYPFHWMWKMMKFFDAGSERRLRNSLAVVRRWVDRTVRSREEVRSNKSDFLSRLAEDGRHSPAFLRDMVINILVAGRDSTPSALSWFFWAISSRPDVTGRVREELTSIRARRGGSEEGEFYTLEELREMQYLHAAVSESLRLFPPAPLLPRACREDDVLPDGTKVRKGWTVMYSAYAMGRREEVWGEDCLEFRPERWLDGDGVFQPRSPFVFPVFHAGPRLCLGREMAYIQMKAVAASILERFEVEVVEERGKHRLSITMTIEGGLPVRVRERNSQDAQGV